MSVGYLREKDTVKEEVCFLLVLGDVSIGIHSKHLRVGNDGKCTHILQIALILHRGKGGRK